ncbi:protein of unknown function [Microbispora rosea]|uniref:DUF4192 domain-containing protein n=1 Tax=Microbispora rosea TaxID=58117 RepID=A0A1N7F9W8_9ACTN|nr:DUF4192 family protein [Microbispora rosea]GIH49629.1 hypothetical protein Mro03_48080 [Microbispora rosea subsp. rosea]SIR97123.1 protein of unknown function [Microbispora rosea]
MLKRIDADTLRAHCADVAARTADPAALAGQLTADGTALADRLHRGDDLDDADAARLAVALHIIRVRDVATARITRLNAARLAVQWSRFGVRVPPVFVAPAAFLAAHACQLYGNLPGTYAALRVALDAQPGYRLAAMLHAGLFFQEDGGFDVSDVALPPAEPAAEWLDPLRERLDLFDLFNRAGAVG